MTTTTLFSGSRSFPTGAFESNVLNVPGAIKRTKIPLNVKVSLEAEPFPAGTTGITIFLSDDGGTSWRSAAMTCQNPATWRGPGPHYWWLAFDVGDDFTPNKWKYAIDSPAAFTTNVIVEANS